MRAILIFLLLLSVNAYAWMDQWAPSFIASPVKVQRLSARSVAYFVNHGDVDCEFGPAKYSEGAEIDLNDDGISDFVFIEPWMGNGLNAAGYTAHFLVSDEKRRRKITSIEGYGIELDDVVSVDGRIYFKHSTMFENFEKSRHNHWVYQMFVFGKDGVMHCANADFAGLFPAVTIFHEKPKFKPIELTEADLEKIKGVTTPIAKIYE